MGYIRVLAVFTGLIILSGCSGKMTTTTVKEQGSKEISSNSVPPMVVPKVRNLKVFDPLEGKTFTFRANSVPVQTVLYTISIDTGLNLIINPDVFIGDDKTAGTVSANFVNTPIKDAMEIIGEMADVFYEIRGNTLHVSKYKTNIFSIPYVSSKSSYKAALGGDVVGAADKDGSTNLTGEFSLQFEKGTEIADFYTVLESNLNAIIAGGEGKILVNKMTGIVSVRTGYSKMKQVEFFLENIVGNAVKQVQIEAKIIEVTLSDGYSYGIDWTRLFDSKNSVAQTAFSSVSGSAASNANKSMGTFYLSLADNFQGVLSAISTYGKVDTLSNPRMTLLNGQNAMISAGTITPFWDKEVKREKTDGVYETTVSYKKYNVLDGLTMGITVFVHDDDSVMLNVVPITTTLLPNVELKEGDLVVATAPKIEIKEAGTLVQVQNNEILVIGGLISNSQKITSSSIPIIGSIPFIGYLFSSETMEQEKKELVILIKPTVVNSKSKVIKR